MRSKGFRGASVIVERRRRRNIDENFSGHEPISFDRVRGRRWSGIFSTVVHLSCLADFGTRYDSTRSGDHRLVLRYRKSGLSDSRPLTGRNRSDLVPSWFVAVIRRRIGEREDKFFATVFFGSGILLTAVMLVGAAAIASAAVTVDLADGQVPDVHVLSALTGLGKTLLILVMVRVQAVFIVSASTLALRTSAFNRWLSYLGYAIAFLMFFMPLVIETLRLGFPIWVAILSIALLIRKDDLIPDHEETQTRPV